MVLLAGLSQTDCLFSNLKQLIKKQNDKISQLHNKVVKLQTVNKMLVDTSVDGLRENETIKKEFRLKGKK